MKPRRLEEYIPRLMDSFPALWLMGPRQSGKTTLAKKLFPSYSYVSFEDLDVRSFASQDPRGFLRQYPGRAILDEVQRVPELLSYLQTHMDQSGANGQYVLTGSQQFALASAVGQSLAGRVALAHLFPFTLSELWEAPPVSIDAADISGSRRPAARVPLEDILFQGLYPAVHHRKSPPTAWHKSYYATYVERDVRQMAGIRDLSLFDTFVRLCAARSACVINLSEIGTAAGLSHATVKSWLGLLVLSGLAALIQPHSRNFSKRLVKAPKLYFMDSGLLCYLLRITSPDQVLSHPLKGAIFETFMASELLKHFWHKGQEPPVFFWRDHKGREIDLLIDMGTSQWPVEMKSSETAHSDFFNNILWWRSLKGNASRSGTVLYGGKTLQVREGVTLRPWHIPF